MALKRCIRTDSRWNKNTPSRASLETAEILRPKSPTKRMADSLIGSRVSSVTDWNIKRLEYHHILKLSLLLQIRPPNYTCMRAAHACRVVHAHEIVHAWSRTTPCKLNTAVLRNYRRTCYASVRNHTKPCIQCKRCIQYEAYVQCETCIMHAYDANNADNVTGATV